MEIQTGISWCDHTFNIAWGCTQISPACSNCYAKTLAERYGYIENGAFVPIWGKHTDRRVFGEKHWREPLKWNRMAEILGERRRVFCSSMADVFEDHAMIEQERKKLWPLIEETPWLDWLLLTKRPEHFTEYVPACWSNQWPSNAWPGVTVESQEYAALRIPHLLKVPASVRFLSCEPLLGAVDLTRIGGDQFGWGRLDCLSGLVYTRASAMEHGCEWDTQETGRVHWVIAGGESGTTARPSHPEWFRIMRDQCIAAGTAFHFKQWGEWLPLTQQKRASPFDEQRHIWPDGREYDGTELCTPACAQVSRVGKMRAGHLLDGVEWNEFPEARS